MLPARYTAPSLVGATRMWSPNSTCFDLLWICRTTSRTTKPQHLDMPRCCTAVCATCCTTNWRSGAWAWIMVFALDLGGFCSTSWRLVGWLSTRCTARHYNIPTTILTSYATFTSHCFFYFLILAFFVGVLFDNLLTFIFSPVWESGQKNCKHFSTLDKCWSRPWMQVKYIVFQIML